MDVTIRSGCVVVDEPLISKTPLQRRKGQGEIKDLGFAIPLDCCAHRHLLQHLVRPREGPHHPPEKGGKHTGKTDVRLKREAVFDVCQASCLRLWCSNPPFFV